MEQLKYFLVETRGRKRLFAAEKEEHVATYIKRVLLPSGCVYISEVSTDAARKTKLKVELL